MFTLAELTIKIKAPCTWPDKKSEVFYPYLTEILKQIAQYANSIDLDDPELKMCFGSFIDKVIKKQLTKEELLNDTRNT